MTADAVKGLLHRTDITGTQHLKKMDAELRKHKVPQEKTCFMEKEQEFVKKLTDVQKLHID